MIAIARIGPYYQPPVVPDMADSVALVVDTCLVNWNIQETLNRGDEIQFNVTRSDSAVYLYDIRDRRSNGNVLKGPSSQGKGPLWSQLKGSPPRLVGVFYR